MIKIRKFLKISSFLVLSSMLSTSVMCMDLPAEKFDHPRPQKNYAELERQHISVNTDGRPEKNEVWQSIQHYKERGSSVLGNMIHKRFLIDLKEKGMSQKLPQALDLIRYLEKENVKYYETLYNQFIQDYKNFKSSSSSSIMADLIPVNDILQREYFYKSIVPQLELEKDFSQKKSLMINSSFHFLGYYYLTNVWNAKTALTMVKAYIEGRVGEPVSPQDRSLAYNSYQAMDGTDKVLIAHFLGQAEYHLEIANILTPFLTDLKKVKETEINALSKAFVWMNEAVEELSYFKISHILSLTTPLFNKEDVIQTLSQDSTATTKKRRKKKISAHQIAMIKESQKKQNETSTVTKSRITIEETQMRQPQTFQETFQEESISDWWFRTEKMPSAGELARRSLHEQQLRQERKSRAKKLKNHIDTRKESEKSEQKEEGLIADQISSSKVISKFSLNNYFSVFQQIMDETYDGEITPILNMIQNGLQGNVGYGSGSRLRLRLRNFDMHKLEGRDLFLPVLMDDAQEEVDNQPEVMGNTKTVVHMPHKRGSKKMRPEHIKSIKTFLQKAGYTLDTVGE